jgi:conjugal transfer ATP-binding protein TraC
MGFVIEAVPLVACDESVEREWAGIIEDVMEEGSSLQVMLYADHRVGAFMRSWCSARSETQEVLQQMARNRSEHLQKGPVGDVRRFRLIVSYSVSRERGSDGVAHLSAARTKLHRTLQAFTYAKPWDAQDLVDVVGGISCFRFERDPSLRPYNPLQDLSSQLTQGGQLSISEEKIVWHGDEQAACKTHRCVAYPTTWSLASMVNLIGDLQRDSYKIQTPFLLQYAVHVPSQSSAESELSRKSQLIENQGKSSALLRMIPALLDEVREHDLARRHLHEGARVVWTQLSSCIWAKPSDLDQHEQALLGLMRIHGFRFVENRYLHFPHLLSNLPMAWGEYASDLRDLSLLKATISTECCNFLPIQGEWMGTHSPGMLLLGRRGQVVNWNPFDNRSGNYNTVVVGRSGSGKSVFMQDLLLSGMGVGARVFILEVGRSFEQLCSSVDGQHIEFAPETSLCLNPFSTISADDKEEELDSLALVRNVLSCMASPSSQTSDLENALLDKAIRRAWNEHGKQTTVTHVSQRLERMSEDAAKQLAYLLSSYCREGVHARYFEGANNVDFTSPMVLIELEELKEKKELQAVVIQLFIMTITNQAFLGERKQPFYICIDEAWDLLRAPQTGVFIETLARRLRKYNGSLVIGTQSVDDFFAAPGAQAAFENSDWMCLLSQKASSIQRLSDSGKIPMHRQMQAALRSVHTVHGEFSEVMICDSDGGYSINRLILDPYSNLLFSTKADDYSSILDLRAQGLSTHEAIERLLQEGRES